MHDDVSWHGPPRGRRPAARRGPLRQLAETRGWAGDFAQPAVDVALTAADGVALEASLLPGPAPGAPALLLAHGFAAHRRKPAYARLADELSAGFHVLTLDLRGHGGSGGRSGLGGLEHLDLAAARAWLAECGHDVVVGVGVSMGATSIANALGRGLDVDALALVSGPAWLHDPPRSEPMRRLDAIWRSGMARRGLDAVFGVSLMAPGEWERPPHPADALATAVASDAAPPVLVVHGNDDAYFPPSHAHALAAAGGATLWLEPDGFGHAEDGVDADGRFARRLGGALHHAVAHGRVPHRDDLAGG